MFLSADPKGFINREGQNKAWGHKRQWINDQLDELFTALNYSVVENVDDKEMNEFSGFIIDSVQELIDAVTGQ